MNRDLEIRELKTRTAALETRLRFLNERIGRIRPGLPSDLRASVDEERCVGCGMCAEVCPAGAITVSDIAKVDLSRCVGCGRCAVQCPKGAIHLLPMASFSQKEGHGMALPQFNG